jgi:hypothetical protein
MSWNAAKRAVRSGYGNVVWYHEGTDGWAAAGLPLEPAEPVPMPDFVDIGAATARPESGTGARLSGNPSPASGGAKDEVADP